MYAYSAVPSLVAIDLISMLYPDLTINEKINAKGNAVTLYRSFRYKFVRTTEGARYNSNLLLKKKEK